MCYILDKEGMKVVLDISNNMCTSCAWGWGESGMLKAWKEVWDS